MSESQGSVLEQLRRQPELILKSAPYHEIAPHLVLMAFLHRVVNGGGPLEGNMPLALIAWIYAYAMERSFWGWS